MNNGSDAFAPLRPVWRVVDGLADWTVVPGYSRVGYALRRRLWGAAAPPSPAGRRILVTGAGSGIGEAACAQLAGAGATVHMCVRHRGRGEAAVERIARALGPSARDRLRLEICDVADLEDVERFAARLSAEVPALHGLVHNAGVLPPTRQRTLQGNELTFATAVLGPFALTRALAEPLRAETPSHVVFVSSGGMYTAELEPADVQLDGREYDGPRFYAHAKRAQVVLASQFAERWAGSGVGFASCHPGWVDTPGLAAALPRFHRLMRPLLRDAAAGADTISWLVAGDATERRPGAFWHDRRPRPADRLPWTATPHEDADRLWEKLVELGANPRRAEALPT